MAVRTVVKGILPGDIEYEGICSNCKTRIECIESDTRQDDSYDYLLTDPREVNMRYVDCPLCSNRLFVTIKNKFILKNNFNDQR